MQITDLPELASRKLIALMDAASAAEDGARSAAARLAQLGADTDFRAIELLQARRAQASNRHAELSALVSNLKTWLTKARGTFERVAPEPVDLQGETIIHVIEKTRDEIAALQHRLDAVRTAPPPAADLRAMAAAHVRELAERGAPRIDVRADRLTISFVDAQKRDPHTAVHDAIAAIAWIDPDGMTKRIEQLIAALPERVDAVSLGERQQRLSEISEELEILERAEESLICAAAEQGIEISRRETADPKCVLGLRLVRSAARAAVA